VSFLLDTDICSTALTNERVLFHRFIQYSGRLYTSRIVLAELYDWAYHRDTDNRLNAIDKLLREVQVLEFDQDCAFQCGRVRHEMRTQGLAVPDMDVLIGSTALVHNLTMVTHNTKDFQQIPGLSVQGWLLP